MYIDINTLMANYKLFSLIVEIEILDLFVSIIPIIRHVFIMKIREIFEKKN